MLRHRPERPSESRLSTRLLRLDLAAAATAAKGLQGLLLAALSVALADRAWRLLNMSTPMVVANREWLPSGRVYRGTVCAA